MRIDASLYMPATAAVCLLFILMMPLAIAGLALINTGLNRSRAAAYAVLSTLVIACVAVVAYVALGFSVHGPASGSYSFSFGGTKWDWMGAGPFFLRRLPLDGNPASMTALFGMISAALASTIPAGSLGERWRLGASCASTALLAGWTYPLFAHWVWGGGWLAQLGSQFGLSAGVLDAAGASCIHTTGGLTALALSWIIGPRRGRFTPDGIPTAMPGHNAVVVLFGSLLAIAGFLGLNSAGAVLFAARTPAQTVAVDINTIVCAAGGTLASLAVTRLRFGRPDASLTANGLVAALVASSAGAPFIKPAEALLIGLIAGVMVIFAVELLELRMKIDDPTGAIAVHAGGGFWGLLAIGIFGRVPASDSSGQFLAQLVGIAALIGFIFPLTYVLNWLLNRILPQRVSAESERQGPDLFELGAGAYPEFVTHREDFLRH